MGIIDQMKGIKEQLPDHVTLVAVSKTKPDEMIMEAYNAGHRDFGENKVQDLSAKRERLPGDIRWHMIGHLQSNKVKYLARFIYMIHGVDSMKLLRIIDREALKHDRIIDCLLQLHIAEEDTKFGLSEQEIFRLVQSDEFGELNNIRIRGIMGMATFTEDSDQIRKEFRHLSRIFEELKTSVFYGNDYFDQRSFGMSADFVLAIEEGSTMIRIGSQIF